MKKLLFLFAFPALSACVTSHQHALVLPGQSISDQDWSPEELQKPVAIRTLMRNADASTHLVRLNANESPHYHDHHNLNVTVLSGQSRLHFENRTVDIRPGDSIFIPQGTYHWAEKTSDQACIISVTFSPAFDGKDMRLAN